jgi:hypothetical protein
MKLIRVTDTDEFMGWDVGDISDTALIFELKHAWKDYFKKHSCPLTVAAATLHPARDFCKRIGIPFRFFIRCSIQILGQFPKPWELNLRWLQEEIEIIWLSMKDTLIPVIQETDEAQKILRSHKKSEKRNLHHSKFCGS